jgi:hypothetical protein
MHEPTQNGRDDVEQYAENRAPQLDGKRTGRTLSFTSFGLQWIW